MIKYHLLPRMTTIYINKVFEKVLDQINAVWYYIKVTAREQQNENKKYLKKYLTKKNKSDKILFVADATLDP